MFSYFLKYKIHLKSLSYPKIMFLQTDSFWNHSLLVKVHYSETMQKPCLKQSLCAKGFRIYD